MIRSLAVFVAPLLTIVSLLFPYDDWGAIPVVNFPTSGDYRADRDAWASVRSRSGRMYFANSEGVLRYNGVSWTLFRLPNGTAVQSLTIDRNGRIIVGSDSEIGILRETPGGAEYTSLTHFVPASLRSFSQVWTADTAHGLSYLQSSQAVFVIDGDSVITIPAPEQFGLTYRMGGRLLVQDRKNGLMELRGRELVPFDSSQFFRTTSVSCIIPATRGRWFIITKYDGVFLYDTRTLRPFLSPLHEILKKNRPYRSTVLQNGDNAIGVVGLGVVIIDSTGTILSVLNKETGLINNTVTSLYDDGLGNVWLTGYHGISRFRYPPPLTSFTQNQGLSGGVKITAAHHGTILAGTIEQLFRMTGNASGTAIAMTGSMDRFTPLQNVREDCSYLLSVGKEILVSTSQGVFVVNGTTGTLVTRSYALPLLRSRSDSNRVFIGTFGLSSMVRKDGRWTDEGLYNGISEDIYQIIEVAPDVLWLQTYNQGFLRVTLAGGSSREVRNIERFGTAEGLTSLTFRPALWLGGRLIVPKPSGPLSFDENSRRFVPDTLLERKFRGLPHGVYAVDPGKGGSYWILLDQPTGYKLTQWIGNGDGTYSFRPLPFALPPMHRIDHVYEDERGICWISTTGGLFRYDPHGNYRTEERYDAAIEGIRLMGNDSLIAVHAAGPLSLHSGENSLRFLFSSNSFADEEMTQYQTFLEGFDGEWTGWSREEKKEYTNLDPGIYTFRVRAKNSLEVLSAEASVTFRILPPWWGTWWFRGLVILFFLTAGPVVYYRRVTELKKEKRQQEEFSRQLINRQEAERKRIAHELHDSISQSLLTIKNRAAMAVDRHDPPWVEEQLRIILSSSTSAIQEVKQITHNLRPYLLDRIGLSKALQSLVRTVGASDSLSVESTIEEIDGMLAKEDEIHLYRIVQELLNNIHKHSEATAAVLTVLQNGRTLSVVVRDNGKGFDTGQRSAQHSTLGGLGLEGMRERVRLLRGTMQIVSESGQGTTVSLTLPIQNTTEG